METTEPKFEEAKTIPAAAFPRTILVSELASLNSSGLLNLHPPFQRKNVWTRRHKQYLLDTILQGKPIPELYAMEDADLRERLIVIDGQQRTTTLIEFLLDGFACPVPFPTGRWFKYSELEAEEQERIRQYPLVLRLIPSTGSKMQDEKLARDIFERLNSSIMPLNPQELRHARYIGPFMRLAEELGRDHYWRFSSIITKIAASRMKGEEFVMDLLLCMMRGAPEEGRRETFDKLCEDLETSFTEEEAEFWKSRFLAVREQLTWIFNGSLWKTGFGTRTEYYSLFSSIDCLLREQESKLGVRPNRSIFEPTKRTELRACLIDFVQRVRAEGPESQDRDVREYWKAVAAHSNMREQRLLRTNIMTKILIPFLSSDVKSGQYFKLVRGKQRGFICDKCPSNSDIRYSRKELRLHKSEVHSY